MNKKFTLNDIMEGIAGQEGFCLHCGENVCGVEPDARKYKCECCGEKRVYGAEQIMLEFPELIVRDGCEECDD